MARRLAPLLLSLLLLLLASPADARKRPKTTQTSSKKRDCEKNVCNGHHEDDKPNCVLRCQSETCYAEVYGGDELEPGEIDTRRSRVFQTCLTNEQKNKKRRPAAAEAEPAAAAATEL